MNIPELFERSVTEYDRRVAAIRDEQWGDPTPCTEWNVRDLVNHMVYEDLWAPGLFAGKTIEDLGGSNAFSGDVLGDDPKAAWADASQAAVQGALDEGAMDRTVHLSFGDFPGSFYAGQLLTDHVIHSWDLARGIGADDAIDPTLVEFCYTAIKPYADSLHESGSFDPPLDAPEDSDLQTKLLALVGRKR